MMNKNQKFIDEGVVISTTPHPFIHRSSTSNELIIKVRRIAILLKVNYGIESRVR